MTAKICSVTEKFNPRVLDWIINNGNLKKEVKTKCEKYLKQYSTGLASIKYTQSVNKGRRAGKGLQSMKSEVRNTICSQFYEDIDIVNCSATLLSQYLAKDDVHCPKLTKYVKKREKQLAHKKLQHLSRSDSKQLVISIMNGGKQDYNNLKKKPTWLTELKEEVENTILPHVQAKKMFRNPKNQLSHVGLLLGRIENSVLSSMCDFFQSKELVTATLMFDGVFVEKSELLTKELLHECCDFIEENTGYRVELLSKPMKLSFNVPKGLFNLELNQEEPEILKYLHNEELGLGEYLAKKHQILNQNGLIHIYHNDIWIDTHSEQLFRSWIVDSVKELQDAKDYLEEQIHPNMSEKEIENIKSFKSTIQSLIGRIRRCTNHSNIIRAMISSPIAVSFDFDATKDIHPGQLAAKNGMIDLKTKEIFEFSPKDRITRKLGTAYDAKTKSKLWEDTVKSCISDKKSYESFRQLIGYTVLGYNNKKKWFIFHGPPNAGKSLLFSVISSVLEFYSNSMDRSVVVKSGSKLGGSHATELMALKGVRLAILGELMPGDKLNDTLIQGVIGGDEMSLREIFGKQQNVTFDFVPVTHANVLPIANTKEIVGKTYIFPLKHEFKKNPTESHHRKIDETLKERLKSEREGILTWIVNCCSDWAKSPEFEISEDIQEATDEWANSQSAIKALFNEQCQFGKDLKVRKGDLYEAYKDICKEKDLRQEKKADFFAIVLADSRIDLVRHKNARCFSGIDLIDEDD